MQLAAQPGIPCHVGSPAHGVPINRQVVPHMLVDPAAASSRHLQMAVEQPHRTAAPPAAVTKQVEDESEMYGDEQQNLLAEEEKDQGPPKVALDVASAAEQPVDGGFDVEDEKAHLLGN